MTPIKLYRHLTVERKKKMNTHITHTNRKVIHYYYFYSSIVVCQIWYLRRKQKNLNFQLNCRIIKCFFYFWIIIIHKKERNKCDHVIVTYLQSDNSYKYVKPNEIK